MDLSKGGRLEVAVSLERAHGFASSLTFSGVDLPTGLHVETGEERDGKVMVALVGDPQVLEIGPHRIVLRGTPSGGSFDESQITKGFTVSVK